MASNRYGLGSKCFYLSSHGLFWPVWVEGLLVFEHAVDQVEEFSHGRADHAHFAFPTGQEALGHFPDQRVPFQRGDRGEVEGFAQPAVAGLAQGGPPAPAAAALFLARSHSGIKAGAVRALAKSGGNSASTVAAVAAPTPGMLWRSSFCFCRC